MQKDGLRPCIVKTKPYPFRPQIGNEVTEARKGYFHTWGTDSYVNNGYTSGIGTYQTVFQCGIVEYEDGTIHKIPPECIVFTDLQDESLEVKIRYESDDIERIERIAGEKSDWIDLRAAEDVKMKAGEYKLISLGVAIELPRGYEAIVVPRSSTFKNFGIIQANSMGVIDESYCGNNDIWHFPSLAMRDTEIHKNDRICQFRTQKHQPEFNFVEVESLGNPDRGGIGSTGIK